MYSSGTTVWAFDSGCVVMEKCIAFHHCATKGSLWICCYIKQYCTGGIDIFAQVLQIWCKSISPSYLKEDLNTALENVRNGRMILYRAAKLYEIPKATLFKHVKGMRGVKSQTVGRPTALPFHEEKKLHECLKLMEKWGFGLSKKKFWRQ